MSTTSPSAANTSRLRLSRAQAWMQTGTAQAWLFAGLVGAVALWSYWPTLATMAERWSGDLRFSYGFLVPLFAAIVLWSRRGLLQSVRAQPSWWGLAFLAPALALRLAGASMDIHAADAVSLLPTLAGLVLLSGGWPALRWSWPAVALLGFMVPLPFQIDTAVAQPLRHLATVATTYALQTLGFPAISEGNIILIDELRLGVIDACSGLGTLMTFLALATAIALIVPAPLLDRWIIVASAVPIAVLANILRITATAIAFATVGGDAAALLHDVFGWLMMPLAVAVLWAELRFLACVLVPVEPSRPLPVFGVAPGSRDGPVVTSQPPNRMKSDPVTNTR